MVFQIKTGVVYPQVQEGKQYTVDYVRDGMVYLLGISHPLPIGVGDMVESSQQEENTFVVTEYELVERVVAYSNTVGSDKLDKITEVTSKVVENYVKNAREVQNLSEFILNTK